MTENILDAFAIRDEEGGFVLDGGYFSFVCEENGNTIRIDPEQFDFEIGSEPFSVEVEDDTYNLYFTKDNTESRETEKEDHDDNLMENYLSMSLNEVEKNPFMGECQDSNNESLRFSRWDDESTQLLVKLYKQICPTLGKNNRVLTKNRAWQRISHELRKMGYRYTPLQVLNRWKTLRRGGCKVMRNKISTSEQSKAHWGMRTNRYKGQLAEILNKNGSVLNLLVNDSLNSSSEKTKLGKLLNKSGGEQVSNNLSHKSNIDDAGSSVNLLNQEKWKKAQTSVRIPTQEKHIWDRESTEFLIHLHKKLSPFVGTPTCVNEHKLWEKLSYELAFSGYTFTPEEVENKWMILVDTIKSKRKEIGHLDKNEVLSNTPTKKRIRVVFNGDLQAVTLADGVKDKILETSIPLQTSSKLRPILPKAGNVSETIRSKWNHESCNLLVELYDELSPLQGKSRLYPTRCIMFKQICEELKKRGNYHFTTEQVENKWRSLERGLYNKIHKVIRKEQTVVSPQEKKNLECTDLESEAEEGSPALQVKEFSEVSRANDNYCEMLKSQSLPKNVSNNTYFDIRREWNQKQTQLLFELYKKHIPLLGCDNNSLVYQKKTEMWKAISLDFLVRGHKFTPEQVSNKWKSMERSLRNKLLRLTNNEGNDKISMSTLRDQFLHKDIEDNEASVHTLNETDEESSYCEDVSTVGQKLTAAPTTGHNALLADIFSRNHSKKAKLTRKMPNNSKTSVISGCLQRLTEAKEKYYQKKIELKEKTLKALEARNIEIKRTNELLQQFLEKNDVLSEMFETIHN